MPRTQNIYTPVEAFRHASEAYPYYRRILSEKGIDVDSITSLNDFHTKAPIIYKEDVFGKYAFNEVYTADACDNFATGILSSGTSGLFSYGILTHTDIENQKRMVDAMLVGVFKADIDPPVVINALPMGVSFVSSFPVIPTSVHVDLVLESVKTFGVEKHIIIITDPHFLKKILEEGIARGISWGDRHVSCIIGGTSFSDSFVQYAQALLNRDKSGHANLIYNTMGITEVGLNLFTGTPDLIAVRHSIQDNPEHMVRLFGSKQKTCPEIMYCMSDEVHVEIVNQDERGVGDVVLTHLGMGLHTMLIRYNSGDRAQYLEKEVLEEMGYTLAMPFPIIAVYGRNSDSSTAYPITTAEVKEALYKDHEYAGYITGHFLITKEDKVLVHMKSGIHSLPEKKHSDIEFIGIPYTEFPIDIDLNYERKWRHFL